LTWRSASSTEFDGREVIYGFGELDELVLAYATTISLHFSIIGEGFWRYVESPPAGSPLRPVVGGANADKISVNADQWINLWIKALGIDQKSYSKKRCFKTKLHAATVSKDEKDYYCGHAAGVVAWQPMPTWAPSPRPSATPSSASPIRRRG